MAKIRNMLNYEQNDVVRKFPPSLTIPQDGLSLKEILKHHSSGNSPAVQKNPEYNPEDSPFAGMDINKMDLIDLQNLSNHIQNLRVKANAEISRKKAKFQEEQAHAARVAVEKAAIEHFKSKQGGDKQH